MSRVLILVEGQTEETFVRDILAPYLWDFGVFCTPTLATTKRVKSGPNFTGGIVSYGKLKFDISRLFRDKDAALITTMIDYYGFSSRVPFKDKIKGTSCFQRVLSLEKLFAEDIENQRFKPYVQLHEFEAMVFVEPGKLAELKLDSARGMSADLELKKISEKFNSPEEINDNPETAPSKRIEKLFPAYQKTAHGPRITAKIGIKEIRKKCKHFSQWVSMLETLGRKVER